MTDGSIPDVQVKCDLEAHGLVNVGPPFPPTLVGRHEPATWLRRDDEREQRRQPLAETQAGGFAETLAPRRPRYELECPECGERIERRAENLLPVIVQLARHGKTEVTLGELRGILPS